MGLKSVYWFNRLLDFGLDNSDLFFEDPTSPEFLFPFLPEQYSVDSLSFDTSIFISCISSFEDSLSFSILFSDRVVGEDVSDFILFDDFVTLPSNALTDSIDDIVNFDVLFDAKKYSSYSIISYFSFDISAAFTAFCECSIDDYSVSCFSSFYLFSENITFFCSVHTPINFLDFIRGSYVLINTFDFISVNVVLPLFTISDYLTFTDLSSLQNRYFSRFFENVFVNDMFESSINLNFFDIVTLFSYVGSHFDVDYSCDFYFLTSISNVVKTFSVSSLLFSYLNTVEVKSTIPDVLSFFDKSYISLLSKFFDYIFLNSSLVFIVVAYGNIEDFFSFFSFLFELGKGFERFGSKVVFVFYDLGFVEGGRGSGERGVSVYVFDKEVTGFSDIITAIDGIYEFGNEEVGGLVVFSLEGVGEQREKRIDRVFHGGRVSGADVYVDGLWFHYNFDRDNSLVVGKGLVGEEVKVVLDNVFELDWVKVRLDLLKRAKYT